MAMHNPLGGAGRDGEGPLDALLPFHVAKIDVVVRRHGERVLNAGDRRFEHQPAREELDRLRQRTDSIDLDLLDQAASRAFSRGTIIPLAAAITTSTSTSQMTPSMPSRITLCNLANILASLAAR